jgi:hypothetical protein
LLAELPQLLGRQPADAAEEVVEVGLRHTVILAILVVTPVILADSAAAVSLGMGQSP